MNILNKVRPNILNLHPYSSARDEFVGVADVYLDANENPYNSGLNRYPDPYQLLVKEQIALLKGISVEGIFLGNGSDEAIDLVIRIFCEPGQDNILVTDPTYGMYSVSAAINNISVKRVPLTEEFELDAELMLQMADKNSKLAFICSPNNPSGNALDHDQVLKVIQNFDGLVVVDEAYIDFSLSPSLLLQLQKRNNLMVLQTFSKAWGLAGVRLGMAFSSPQVICLMNKVKPPYNINILTQSEVLKALSNPGKKDQEINSLLQEREWLVHELLQFELVEKIFPSDSNFLLVRFQKAPRLFEYLTGRKIIVRDRTNVRGGENCLRITVGTPDENKILIKALKDYTS